MKSQSFAAVSFLCAGLFLGAPSNAQQPLSTHDLAQQSSKASATTNLPQRSGEASTMTDGVPNLSASNPQPGELGIQTRMTVRKAPTQSAGAPDLATMGAAGSSGVAPQALPSQSQRGMPD